MIEEVQTTIQEVARRLIKECDPQKIILFGSYAQGVSGEDSDLDFLVVMDTRLPPLERYVRVRQALGSLDIPIDVFVLTPEEFEETREIIGGLAYAPAKYGRVVYEKP